ncbi:hypothetical protein ACFY5K_32685 [Streptomyces griseofuscus]|uniref:hypothetical protein n=1 Tax=Streptomyces TaxID=1883 RepID=UPI0018F0FE7A|nr:hypothetical protein [Streptomyces sp. CRPSP2-6A1]MBJ6998600.1 hypothetical protein [Streptomyces sp. CRPSP2-6A1]
MTYPVAETSATGKPGQAAARIAGDRAPVTTNSLDGTPSLSTLSVEVSKTIDRAEFDDHHNFPGQRLISSIDPDRPVNTAKARQI